MSAWLIIYRGVSPRRRSRLLTQRRRTCESPLTAGAPFGSTRVERRRRPGKDPGMPPRLLSRRTLLVVGGLVAAVAVAAAVVVSAADVEAEAMKAIDAG